MPLTLELLAGMVFVMVTAFFWGRPGAVLGWLAVMLGIVGIWIAEVNGENSPFAFVIIILFTGGLWLVLGPVAALTGLNMRALYRGKDEPDPPD